MGRQCGSRTDDPYNADAARKPLHFQALSSRLRNLAGLEQAHALLRGGSMRKFAFTVLLFGLSAGVSAAQAQASGRLSVPVSGLRSDEGVVRCGLYAGARGLPQSRTGEPRGHRQNQGGTGDLRFQRLEAGNLCGRRVPRRERRNPNAVRHVRQAEGRLWILPQSARAHGSAGLRLSRLRLYRGAQSAPIRLTY